MPPLVHNKATPNDPTRKKTKSRNGCARCKLKRLKCDETPGACLQCKKRNTVCPGYERTLKWSTKYEVFKPVRFEQPYTLSNVISTPPSSGSDALAPDVASGFEAAIAAVSGLAAPTNVSHDVEDAVSSVASTQTLPHEESTAPQGDVPSVDDLTDLANLTPLLDYAELDEALDQSFMFDPNFDFTESYPPSEEDLDIEELPPSEGNTIFVPTSRTQQSSSLLLDYYRLPPPDPVLGDIQSILVQHYFKDVCVLFSSFDSLLNPFRTTIGRIFQGSSSIFYAIQSMAAAHLANTFPSMTGVGFEMQRKACESFQAELPLVQTGQMSGTTSFLSIILLGMTTTWHESSALGEEYLATARSLILPKLLCNSGRDEVKRETQFFEESLLYWEMLMGFVTQDTLTCSPVSMIRNRSTTQNKAPSARDRNGKIVPHPWTGIAPTIQLLFAEVGRLVRRERILHMTGALNRITKEENLLNAASLEEDLLAANYPSIEELADPGDERTAKRDFIIMAEAYRCAGLLEIYRVFPSILRKRLGADNSIRADNLELVFPVPRFDTLYEATDTKLWINSLALHVLDALESLPSSSGTCCLQPILLVAAASELRYTSSIDYFDVYANDARVARAREFVHRRLQEFAVRLPAKPIRKAIEIVREVWRRLDGGGECFWIDVMVEKGWGTLMG